MPDNRPRIRIRTGDSPATLRELAQKLREQRPPQLFLRDTEIVYVCDTASSDEDPPDTENVRLLRAKPATVMAYCERRFRFEIKSKKRGWYCCHMPHDLAQRFLALPDHAGLFQLKGFAPCPTLRPDGSLLSQPGYDQQTGLYQTGNLRVSVPEEPTEQQARDALAEIRALVSSFPFAGGKDGDGLAESVAIAAIIGALLRPCLPTMPATGFTAPARGSGKSYLANVIAMIATGRPMPSMTVNARLDEFEKAFGAMLFEAHPIICLDNVETRLRGALLAESITEPDARIRLLGRSEMLKIPTTTAILATGNNLQIEGDLTRRWLVCQLDAGMERPEERKFTSDPLAEASNRRAELISAALTIVRYGLSLDPRHYDGGFPGFQEWYRRVALPLVALGMPDPVGSLALARATDTEQEALEALMAAWWAKYGDQQVNCRKVVDEAGPDLEDAFKAVASDSRGEPCTQRLGRFLSGVKDRIVAGKRFVRLAKGGDGVRWRLEEVASPSK
jgi:putative DNA primase/helicase